MRASDESRSPAGLRDALQDIAERARELERRCLEAAEMAAGLDARPAAPGGVAPPLEPRQAALLVAVTLRGGTVEGALLDGLARRLELAASAVADLFAGGEPHLIHRPGGAAGVTERGLDAAAAWRPELSPDLLAAATDR